MRGQGIVSSIRQPVRYTVRYAQLVFSGIYPQVRQSKPVTFTKSAKAIVAYMQLSLDVGNCSLQYLDSARV